MEIFIIFLCISQIFLYLIWLWLYIEFQDLNTHVAAIEIAYDLFYGGEELESKTKDK